MWKYLHMLCLGLTACGDKSTDTASVTDDTNVWDTNETVFDLASVLDNPSGCADFIFLDHNADDTVSLEIFGVGLAQRAHETGEPQEIVLDIATSDQSIQIVSKRGTHVTHELCNDDWGYETVVEDSFVPVNGKLYLTVTPNGESLGEGSYPSDIEVRLEHVDFCADIGNGETHHENCFHVSEYSAVAAIGWQHG